MNRSILQIPLSLPLKQDATFAAEEMGFSSLQELVRVILTKIAKKQLTLSIQDNVPLSPTSEQRYSEIDQNFQNKKNIFTAHSLKELMDQLNDDSLRPAVQKTLQKKNKTISKSSGKI
jgi:hypothetical protein